MKWLGFVIAGPTIWAIGFSLVYALQGAGCNLGWLEINILGLVSLQYFVLWVAWLATLAANLALLLALPTDTEGRLTLWLPRAGAWIGLVATFFSLLPVAITTSC